ncbi:site-specific integrase [Paenibacillus sp. Soil522]|uniref:site-specific integrase n=1 Tax=Paenibacillus sp. Soil522 TaxID=1736388 RepID=UPI000700A129|nr:site-specific integrase [Paenibacillus sp. Soil522]KRE31627.1 integrase [Paenibacillus sp. Soil522]
MEFVQPIRDRKKIDAMKKILRATSMRDFCLFTMGINGGLRISDLLLLTLGHVINERGKVLERISIREQKTGKMKDYPINEVAAKAIREYLADREWESLDEPLFVSRKLRNGVPSPIQRDQAYKIINAAARQVGIMERIGTHTMRKTFGYMAYKEGYSIQKIQQILNHSSERITLRYIGITQDELDDIHIHLNL